MKQYTLKYSEIIYDRCGEQSIEENEVTLQTDDLEWSWDQYCRNRRIVENKYTLVDERN